MSSMGNKPLTIGRLVGMAMFAGMIGGGVTLLIAALVVWLAGAGW